MSSLGTGRAREAAWEAYYEACNGNAPDEECKRLYRAYLAAKETDQDYLQAERDDARAERGEQ